MFNSAISTHIDVNICIHGFIMVWGQQMHNEAQNHSFFNKGQLIMFTFGIEKDEYHPWICWKWYMNIHNSCTYTSFIVSVKYQLINQIILPNPAAVSPFYCILRYLIASMIYSYCIFDNFLYALSKCPNQWTAQRCIRWYEIDRWLSIQENYSPVLAW